MVLSLIGVSKHFGDLVAVDDASFDVADGEFVSILGPSGSGKSTILRMIAGFEKPTEGEIRIRDRNVVGMPPFERNTNMVFQSLALFPHLTVSGNIAYGLKNQGIQADEREDRIQRSLEMVRLEGYGDRDPNQLSGGEQQRVALARALVNEPEIVLFDEPLASLDRKLRQHMQVELQRIQSETDITFLYVTHDQEVAMAVSDRLVLLNDGEIEQVGSAKELYEKPVSQFVADFIGDVNTISGTVREVRNGQVHLEAGPNGEFTFDAVHSDDNARLSNGNEVAICVRPHHITLSDEASSSGFTVPGEVRNRIYQGNEVDYILNTDVGTISATTNTETFQIGDTVHATWPKEEVHIFPADGEQTVPTDMTVQVDRSA